MKLLQGPLCAWHTADGVFDNNDDDGFGVVKGLMIGTISHSCGQRMLMKWCGMYWKDMESSKLRNLQDIVCDWLLKLIAATCQQPHKQPPILQFTPDETQRHEV